jgi:lactam utilization protein B/allophanate hydrolase subunit 2
LKINCDIGERGAEHPIDRELMQQIDIANIACGGHAGDAESIAAFCKLADENDVAISAHLSYPDRENFGRLTLQIDWPELADSLKQQLQRIPDADMVKLHGALYNDSVADPVLAEHLAEWFTRNGIKKLITPAGSQMAIAAQQAGIKLVAEAFADRQYRQDERGNLHLVCRSQPGAVLEEVQPAILQCEQIAQGRIILDDGTETGLTAETLCIHSDSDIAIALIQELKNQPNPPFKFIYRGLCEMVKQPQYGQQDLGITPYGPQDRFSFATGQILLGANSFSLEFILPPVLHFIRPARCILSGARFKTVRIVRGEQTISIPHATPFCVEPGDQLRFGKNQTGLRGYLAWNENLKAPAPCTQLASKDLTTWNDPLGKIRILAGPELNRLDDPNDLISKPWKINAKSNAMGIQLETIGNPLAANHESMISAPVTDGTIQLTPAGPIILMRHRQTVGGYPRIANVIEVDLNRLAQFRPGEVIHFEWVDMETARSLLRKQQRALKQIKASLPHAR